MNKHNTAIAILTLGLTLSPYAFASSADKSAENTTSDFVYVASLMGGNVSGYKVGADGQLSRLPQGYATCGPRPVALTFDPSYDVLFALNSGDNSVSELRVNFDGTLSQIKHQAILSQAPIASIAVSSTESMFYLLKQTTKGPEEVDGFAIEHDGTVDSNPVQTLQCGALHFILAVDNTGSNLYIAGKSEVTTYHIQADGKLLQSHEILLSSPVLPVSIGFSPNNKFAYLISFDGRIFEFGTTPDAELTPLSSPSIRQIPSAKSITFNASDKVAYVTDKVGSIIYEYSVSDEGVLTRLHPSLIPANQSLDSTLDPTTGKKVFTASDSQPIGAVVSTDGKFAYVANETGQISEYNISDRGSLSFLSPGSVPSPNVPMAIVSVSFDNPLLKDK